MVPVDDNICSKCYLRRSTVCVSLPQKMAKVAKYSWETQPKWFTCACLYEASRTILRESALKVL